MCASIALVISNVLPDKMGFGLNVALVVMKAIMDTILVKDEFILQATSACIDDIYVNEDRTSAT